MRRTKEENKMTGIMTENEVDRWMDVGGGGVLLNRSIPFEPKVSLGGPHRYP